MALHSCHKVKIKKWYQTKYNVKQVLGDSNTKAYTFNQIEGNHAELK